MTSAPTPSHSSLSSSMPSPTTSSSVTTSSCCAITPATLTRLSLPHYRAPTSLMTMTCRFDHATSRGHSSDGSIRDSPPSCPTSYSENPLTKLRGIQQCVPQRRRSFPGVAATTQRRRRTGRSVGHGAGAVDPVLQWLGLNGRQRAAAVGSIIGRMAVPSSERATYRWLCQRSALGELLQVDFETMSMMQLYRAADALCATSSRSKGICSRR